MEPCFATLTFVVLIYQASELQQKIENAGGQVLKDQKTKVANIQSVSIWIAACICFFVLVVCSTVSFSKCQELDKTSSEINRHKVKITSGEKLVKKLAKSIEESKIDTDKLLAQKEKMMSIFKDIEKKAFVVQEDYKKTQEVFVQSHCSIGWVLIPDIVFAFSY
jgi:structural maintenance of chromosome 4